MKLSWIKRDDNDNLILIFAGWNTDAVFYGNIRSEGWDILVCHDFDGCKFDTGILEKYPTIYLYAWSLGVHAAAELLADIKLTAAFAINGTETPCHDSKGIPCDIYHGTADALSIRNLEKFRRRMFSSRQEYESMQHLFPQSPDIELLRKQLLRTASVHASTAELWSRVYISENDRIFPAENQKKAWQSYRGKPQICMLPGGAHYADIAKIICATIPDYEKVGANFCRSLPTYDEYAGAQLRIASHLDSLLSAQSPEQGGRVLEIGQGSGLLTRMLAKTLRPSTIDCVDLYETPEVDTGAEMHYHCGEAQKWLSHSSLTWDYILSTSAIQWFANLPEFFKDAAAHLSERGMLACSSFIDGNLEELDALRPSPIIYPTAERIEAMVRPWFENVTVETERITLRFESALEALMHLRHTGVAGSGHNGPGVRKVLGGLRRDEEGYFRLTYRPVYIIASNPKR